LAVQTLTPEKCLEMRQKCEKRADEFGLESFAKQLWEVV
jgi:hypothetical protein